jgi:proteasome lid subunit RPN8/RPN11
MTLTIPPHLLGEVYAQAEAERPRECCGVLGGARRAGAALAASRYPLRNDAARPESQFFAAPADLFAAMRRMRERREDLVAVYHSHPRGPAHPSATDLALAFYPEALLLIVTLLPRPAARAFQIVGRAAREVAIAHAPGGFFLDHPKFS